MQESLERIKDNFRKWYRTKENTNPKQFIHPIYVY